MHIKKKEHRLAKFTAWLCDIRRLRSTVMIYVQKQTGLGWIPPLSHISWWMNNARSLSSLCIDKAGGEKTFLCHEICMVCSAQKNMSLLSRAETAFHDLSFMKNACVFVPEKYLWIQTSVRLGRNQSSVPRWLIIHPHWDAFCTPVKKTKNKEGTWHWIKWRLEDSSLSVSGTRKHKAEPQATINLPSCGRQWHWSWKYTNKSIITARLRDKKFEKGLLK